MFLHHGTYRVKKEFLAQTWRSVNALRHVTYRNRAPWISEEDLVLTKTLPERIKYVRQNLLTEDGKKVSQPAFAAALGKTREHHGVVQWEKHGREPAEEIRSLIADLTDGAYRPEVFSRAGAEEIVVSTAVPRLQELEAEKASAGDVKASLQVFAAAIDSLAKGDTRAARRLLTEAGYL